MCVFDHPAETQQCLDSLRCAATDVEFEVIVVDDASRDRGVNDLRRHFPELTWVTNEHNLGFLRSANRGIAQSSGEYVVLLNNDTEVTDGWLDRLVEVVDQNDSVGVVGSRLVYPDGLLQEAGAIIFSDGSGWNYGRGDDPSNPAYCYRRKVDYCSGAALLVRRTVLDSIGGLDERFAPAYYEDTDLAFAARSIGFEVVYQPESTVVHHEGMSHGTDEAVGPKMYQRANRTVFSEKWRTALELQPPARWSSVARARDRATGPRVLIIDDKVPMPDHDSGSVRMSAIIDLLLERDAAVTFVPANLIPAQPYTRTLQRKGVEVLYHPYAARPHLRELAPILDVSVVSRPDVASGYLPFLKRIAPTVPVVYDAVDLYHVRSLRRFALEPSLRNRARATLDRRREFRALRLADVVTAITPEERSLIAGLVGHDRVCVLPNIHNVDAVHAWTPDGRDTLLFIGSFTHEPNIDAVLWFARDIFPLILSQAPEARLTVVGGPVPPEISALESSAIEVLGHVADLEPLCRRARVFVAPLRYGAGMKGKIGGAMSYALPVVTTTTGTEGFDLRPGEHVSVADDASSFAAEVVSLWRDDARAASIARAGNELVKQRFGPAAGRDRLDELFIQIDKARSRH